MTISRGQAWGELGPLPDDGVVVRSDAEATSIIESARRSGQEPPPLGLLGGDLCRTLGGRGDESRLHRDDAARLTVDLLVVTIDDQPERVALAHVIARGRSWLFGPVAAAMNAAWVGEWNVAPRAHPNDGVFDLLEANLSLGDRLKARRRLPLGTHVPHPKIRTARKAEVEIATRPLQDLWLDGVRIARGRRDRRVTVRVEPDALCVVV